MAWQFPQGHCFAGLLSRQARHRPNKGAFSPFDSCWHFRREKLFLRPRLPATIPTRDQFELFAPVPFRVGRPWSQRNRGERDAGKALGTRVLLGRFVVHQDGRISHALSSFRCYPRYRSCYRLWDLLTSTSISSSPLLPAGKRLGLPRQLPVFDLAAMQGYGLRHPFPLWN